MQFFRLAECAAFDIFGIPNRWDPLLGDCWYTNDDRARRLAWQVRLILLIRRVGYDWAHSYSKAGNPTDMDGIDSCRRNLRIFNSDGVYAHA